MTETFRSYLFSFYLMNEYFFIAISTRENLKICKMHAYAGFPNTINGLWAYEEIKLGDFVTFLYGARAHNLYKVIKKEAIADAENLPPWKPIYFRKFNKNYYFPFRLHLEQVRELEEPLARQEFLYVAENLLRRGGYEKTHFQADQTTLYNASQMGRVSEKAPEPLSMPPHRTFIPSFVRGRKDLKPPEINQFKEMILQALLRQHLSKPQIFEKFVGELGLSEISKIKFEVLGERALSEGHVDILAKEAEPRGTVRQIIIEAKLGNATQEHAKQLQQYVNEIENECLAGVLIAENVSKKVSSMANNKLHFKRYAFEGVDLEEPHTFEELLSTIQISPST